MKRILKISGIMLLMAYLLLVLGFVRQEYESILCNGVDVVIHDSVETAFVTPPEIYGLINLEHPDLAGRPVQNIDLSAIEESLRVIPAIHDVQVFTTVEGTLKIELDQRKPVARVGDADQAHYYLDNRGYRVPARPGFAPDVPFFNGHIPGRLSQLHNLLEDSNTEDRMLVEGILALAKHIRENPFWDAQIVQVYVDRSGSFELIPRVGAHIILFGGAADMEEKFFKLETLYRRGFPNTGWNQYEQINLKYKNQIVCTKK